MSWQELSTTEDLISYEKIKKDLKIRIEGRMNKDNTWSLYKTYMHDEDSYVEEYHAQTKEDMQKLLSRLMKEKDLTLQQIIKTKNYNQRTVNVKLKRSYKDYEVEKWYFSINGGEEKNFIVIRFGPGIIIDLVIHSKFKIHEEKILPQIHNFLGLEEFTDNLQQNIYYFDTHETKTNNNGKGMLIGRIGMEFRIDEEK